MKKARLMQIAILSIVMMVLLSLAESGEEAAGPAVTITTGSQ